jgi:hypothetical protein
MNSCARVSMTHMSDAHISKPKTDPDLGSGLFDPIVVL